ncbi:MAG: hypothetical protein QOG15_2744 [Solirubrobacteraceae bacterium]|jgi:hypothetical protein|nr:hypothetical protein [Solirubrobacteraceae bacterium]
MTGAGRGRAVGKTASMKEGGKSRGAAAGLWTAGGKHFYRETAKTLATLASRVPCRIKPDSLSLLFASRTAR